MALVCGGTLIRPQHILVDMHCFTPGAALCQTVYGWSRKKVGARVPLLVEVFFGVADGAKEKRPFLFGNVLVLIGVKECKIASARPVTS